MTSALLTGCTAAPADPSASPSSSPAGPAAPTSPAAPAAIDQLSLQIHAEHPHDPAAFTQGLELLPDGRLAESTGGYGDSEIRIVEPRSGSVEASKRLSPFEFGEGLTVVDEQILQLTWKAGALHTWDIATLDSQPTRSYEGEGWGLCHDTGRELLWRSDGSATLLAHDPQTFEPLDRSIEVTRAGAPVSELNELECTDAGVWANVWKSTEILRIDPESGRVTGVLDASELRDRVAAATDLGPEDVLNGIAYDADRDRWYLTGKRWPTLFEVSLTGPEV